MNTYVLSNTTDQPFAIRASRKAVEPLGFRIIPASKKLTRDAKLGIIPTFRILANGQLGLL